MDSIQFKDKIFSVGDTINVTTKGKFIILAINKITILGNSYGDHYEPKFEFCDLDLLGKNNNTTTVRFLISKTFDYEYIMMPSMLSKDEKKNLISFRYIKLATPESE